MRCIKLVFVMSKSVSPDSDRVLGHVFRSWKRTLNRMKTSGNTVTKWRRPKFKCVSQKRCHKIGASITNNESNVVEIMEAKKR